jgi:hypothetical protein
MWVLSRQPEGRQLTQAGVLHHMAQITVHAWPVLCQQLQCLSLSNDVVDIRVAAVLWLLVGCPDNLHACLDALHTGMQGCKVVQPAQKRGSDVQCA